MSGILIYSAHVIFYNFMITTVLLVGICLKVGIVCFVWMNCSSSGKSILDRLKEKILPQKKVYLTQNMISKYQEKINLAKAMEDEEVEPEEGREWPDYNAQTKKSLEFLKTLVDGLKNIGNKSHGNKCQSLFWSKSDLSLPSRSEKRIDAKALKEELSCSAMVTSKEVFEDAPTVPSSRSLEGNGLNFKQFIKVSQAAELKRRELLLRKHSGTKNSAARQFKPQIRSRLAASLERKLPTLSFDIDVAGTLPKRLVIEKKLIILETAIIRRQTARGKSELSTIQEENNQS